MSTEGRELVLGGQAVIEGVMMKGPSSYSVAVRKMNGEIRVRDFGIAPGGPLRTRLAKAPLVRGVVTMAAMLVIGYRALQYSADEAMADAEAADAAKAGKAVPGEGKEGEAGGNGWAMAVAMGTALLAGIALFFWLPLALTKGVQSLMPGGLGKIAFNLVDGLIRVLVFVAYVGAISLMKDIRRIFQYHGAEHKVVNAYEKKAPLSPESVMGHSCLHPRCGTSFLLFVMVISILVFSVIPHETSLAVKALLRLVLLPAVAGLSYETLRLTAKRHESGLFKVLIAPGLLLQRLTTREPDLSQVEVALTSFRRVLPEGEREAASVG